MPLCLYHLFVTSTCKRGINKGEGIRVFYETLLEQNPKSVMALKWCVEHGVNPTALDPNKAVLLLKERLAKHKQQQRRADAVKKIILILNYS